ncbi:Auxin-responsive protein IAA3 [Hibiscus syriacus]|uniref:Auxin-responsive protein n=1 Tax=Hibiscus syriacus TaxID=106335 RepID=A0A6A3AKK7_HIBSY|nr:Auxin-responsive protein IAA3 [Hibiscus syriacus]
MSTPLERSSEKILSSSSPSFQFIEDKTRKTTDDSSLNLKETELSLGLPGSHAPRRKICLFGKDLESNGKSNGFAVFSDAIDGPNEKRIFSMNGESDVELAKPASIKEVDGVPSGARELVVGWPPVRSLRKNTMAPNSASNEATADCLYVKVSMDGAPYLRKVDLKTCKNYMELSSALEKMFSCFTISEYVLTYEDNEGDRMLVGDVPWQMFTDSCRRIRITKGTSYRGHGDAQEL